MEEYNGVHGIMLVQDLQELNETAQEDEGGREEEVKSEKMELNSKR